MVTQDIIRAWKDRDYFDSPECGVARAAAGNSHWRPFEPGETRPPRGAA